MTRPPFIHFTAEAQQKAYELWGANCGPNALAVVSWKPLDEMPKYLIGFDLKRYTNPSMMENGLNLLGLKWSRDRGLNTRTGTPKDGLARVQWEGRWLDPGVPKVVSYRHTHWIACFNSLVFCTACGCFGWLDFKDYSEYLTTKFCPQNGYRGWHITHRYEINRNLKHEASYVS